MEQNFLFENKENLLDIDSITSKFPKDKIIHIKIPSITIENAEEIYTKMKSKEFIQGLKNNGLSKNDLFKISFLELSAFLLNQDFLVNDLIIISDIDEIPNLDEIQEIQKRLIYGPLFFKSKNFIWSDNFYLKTKHESSIVFDFSHLIGNKNVFYTSYISKNNFRTRKNYYLGGWHLSHFYGIDRSLKKLKILHADTKIEIQDIIESIRNLEYPLRNIFGVKEKLCENDEKLPFSTQSLQKTFLGRPKPKKYLVTFNDHNLDVNHEFDEEIRIPVHKKFIPKNKLYETFGNDFTRIYLLNEIPKYLRDINPLNKDIFYIILNENLEIPNDILPNHIDSERKFVVFDWKTIKENILSDLIFI